MTRQAHENQALQVNFQLPPLQAFYSLRRPYIRLPSNPKKSKQMHCTGFDC